MISDEYEMCIHADKAIEAIELYHAQFTNVEPVQESLEEAAFQIDNDFNAALNKLLSEKYESLHQDGILILEDLREVAQWGDSYQRSVENANNPTNGSL